MAGIGLKIALMTAAALMVPGVAQAQIGGGGIGPWQAQDMRPLGIQMGRYHSGEYTAHFDEDECKQLGCLIVINKSQSFEITQFYLNDGKTDARGVPEWGANQFNGFRLEPSRALWTPRPRKMKCELLVRVVLRNPESKEEVETVQPLNMCDMPKGGFAVLGIQADGPRVILESGN